MQIYFSGMDQSACRRFLAGVDAHGHEYVWCEPEAIVAQERRGERILWLYEPPWVAAAYGNAALTDGSHTLLERWLEVNRATLNARQRLAGRLTMANMHSTPAATLCAYVVGDPLPTPSRAEPHEATPVTAIPAQTLAWAFDHAMPDYMDVLKALEANAWQPPHLELSLNGRAAPSPADIEHLLDMLRQGSMQGVATATRVQQADALAQNDVVKAERDRLAKLVDEQRAEASELTAELERTKQAHDAVNAELSKIRQDAATLRASQEQLQADLKQQHEESQLLLEQLHTVQEEYERFYLSHQDMAASNQAHAQEIRELKQKLARCRERIRKLKAAVDVLQGITNSPTVRTALRARRSIARIIPYRTSTRAKRPQQSDQSAKSSHTTSTAVQTTQVE